ncbi:MAG: biotin attachment protein [Deltaproteobacteria bacterium]|jgi:biotin carboxyl carrier protein|nr:biotin attachment protein [Deltaproteobacteria bacterium]
MLDVSKLLEEIQASPYAEIVINAPHSGAVTFSGLRAGSRVVGPTGLWKEKEGTLLATLERERNPRPIYSTEKGEVTLVHEELAGAFVQAGTELMRLRHYLSREEVLSAILKKSLHLFAAPERAKYYFISSVDVKISVSGPKAISVHDGMDLFIMSRMKRESPLAYTGPEGVIYAVYFSHNENVDAGQPLIGVCPPDMVSAIEDVVMRVQTEWREEE